MRKLLLTGYEPFDDYSINPSAELAKIVDGQIIGKYQIVSAVLPLDYVEAFPLLKKLIDEHAPDVLLCTGQANRPAVTIEKIAVNALSIKKADNYENTPDSDVIDDQGPAAYFTNINPQPLVEAIEKEDIPAFVSYHAGIYGCNWIIYKVMQWINSNDLNLLATFIHIPPLPSQAIEKEDAYLATMPLGTIAEAIKAVILNLPI
ncbi:MAG: pyroglutamyl-peptidase I family protein [Candidatus Thorarchaeota archaeon]|jgi:pyroglutamyl-peptidase